MLSVKLKVCGITCLDDALAAIDCGADYLGFNFYPASPRYIRPAAVRTLLEKLDAPFISVGVFVNLGSPTRVVEVLDESGVMTAQLHGDEDAAFCREIGPARVIKVVRPTPSFDSDSLREYEASSFLVDAADPRLYGGTGRTSNWEVAQSIAREHRVFLAGGLSPENIREAIETVRPFAVDVNSGVESSPGRKDRDRLSQLRLEMDR